jgi:UDP-N-acetylglucosamine transferase subunit ALG13
LSESLEQRQAALRDIVVASPRSPVPAIAAARPGRTVLVASPGGHLDELRILGEQLGVDFGNAIWVTSPTPQTESALRDAEVVWVPRIGSGERRKAALALPRAVRLHRHIRPARVISTGALLAVPHLMAACLAGCETWFIDSATRVAAPSATGRFASRVPKVKLFVQGTGWHDPRWTPIPGVFEAFEAQELMPAMAAISIRSAVVTLGTELWPFHRAVQRVLALLPDAKITWQTGTTQVVHRGHRLRQWLPATELREAIRRADVVISHAGVGSALTALDAGKIPVLLPRRSNCGEHIDDHQSQAADLLARRSLAVCVDPDDLSYRDLLCAAGRTARRRSAAPVAAAR